MAKTIPLPLTTEAGYRQRAWALIRLKTLHGETIGIPQLAAEIDADMLMVREYIVGLINAGFVERVALATKKTEAQYRMARDNGAEFPRVKRDGAAMVKGLAEEQMWRVLRSPVGADINAGELAAHASTQHVAITPIHAGEYLEQLAVAKYVERHPAKRGKAGATLPTRYRFVANTGPRPPMTARVDALYDPNLSTLVWIQPVTEETCLYGN